MTDNFIIGTIRDHINLLFSNLNLLDEKIPTKLAELLDLAGKWETDDSGNILPVRNNDVSIGSPENSLKSIYVSEGSVYIIKTHQDGSLNRVKLGINDQNTLEIREETFDNIDQLHNNIPSSSSAPRISEFFNREVNLLKVFAELLNFNSLLNPLSLLTPHAQ